MFDSVGVALGVKTNRRLTEKIARIEDPMERVKALEKLYKKENAHLGEACASTVVNTARIPTPVGVLAAPRAVWSALQVRAAANNRDTIEHLALQEGVDIHEGPRKRDIARGVLKGVLW